MRCSSTGRVIRRGWSRSTTATRPSWATGSTGINAGRNRLKPSPGESAPISPPAEVPTNGWISVTAAPENINRNAIGPGAGKRACRFRTTSPRVPGAADSDLKMCCAIRRPMPKASATGVSPPAWSAIQSGNSRIASANAAAAKSNSASSTATSSNSAATGSRKVTSPIRNCLLPAASIS